MGEVSLSGFYQKCPRCSPYGWVEVTKADGSRDSATCPNCGGMAFIPTPNDLKVAATLLRDAGWTVTPPTSDVPPDVAVGQVWRTKNGHEQRTVTSLVKGKFGVVTYKNQEKRSGSMYGCNWDDWVLRTGARPV